MRVGCPFSSSVALWIFVWISDTPKRQGDATVELLGATAVTQVLARRPLLGHMLTVWSHHSSTTEGLQEVGLLAKLPLENSWGCWKPVTIRCPFILLYPSGMAHRLIPKETHHPL